MDGSQFDQITKTLANGPSRRGLVRLLGGGLLGSMLGLRGLTTATAATAACVDECAHLPNARARAGCERGCTQREAARERRGCPEGRTKLSNGTCAIPCSNFRDCPGSEEGQAGGCICLGFDEASGNSFCVEEFQEGAQRCGSTYGPCPEGTICLGRGDGETFHASCQPAC